MYANGTEWEPIVPLSPGAVVPRDMNARQWDRFVAQAGIQADGKVKTFTPTWTGFSLDPTGDISYLDYGSIVQMWTDDGFVGVSNAVTMTLSGVPEAVRPLNSTRFVACEVINDALTYAGYAAVHPNGEIVFWLTVIDTVRPTMLVKVLDEFENTGTKGLQPGWFVTFVK